MSNNCTINYGTQSMNQLDSIRWTKLTLIQFLTKWKEWRKKKWCLCMINYRPFLKCYSGRSTYTERKIRKITTSTTLRARKVFTYLTIAMTAHTKSWFSFKILSEKTCRIGTSFCKSTQTLQVVCQNGWGLSLDTGTCLLSFWTRVINHMIDKGFNFLMIYRRHI